MVILLTISNKHHIDPYKISSGPQAYLSAFPACLTLDGDRF